MLNLPMPKLRPLPIKTCGLPWWKKTWVWITSTREWEVIEEYKVYFPKYNVSFVIPEGFIFDGASIPKIFRSFLSPTGILFIPGLFHDFGYRYGGYIKSFQGMIFFEQNSKETIDDVFFDMGVMVNDLKAPNFAAWTGVQFAYFTWKNHRKNNKKVNIDFPVYRLGDVNAKS